MARPPTQTRLAAIEAAEQRLAQQPVVVRGGAHVAPKYREVLLRPTDRRAHGHAVWSAADGQLHLYHRPTGGWNLSSDYTPDEDTGYAYIDTPALPAGEATWHLWSSFRSVGEGWEDGALTLVVGDAAAVRLELLALFSRPRRSSKQRAHVQRRR